ncbi:MAG: DUF4416 family protein [Thermodesulfobacteriota bacterium]
MLQEPPPVKFFIGLIYSQDAPVEDCIMRLKQRFGDIDFRTEELSFDFTAYYEEEMGKGLWREIISFKKLIKREGLVEIKIFTNELEKDFSAEGKRKINIDPGYIAAEHLILATGKGYYHRPYLGKGVYADLTLVYKHKEFHALEWTYPDYGGDYLKKLFKKLREDYMLELEKETKI